MCNGIKVLCNKLCCCTPWIDEFSLELFFRVFFFFNVKIFSILLATSLTAVAFSGMHLGLKITHAPAPSILCISAFFPCKCHSSSSVPDGGRLAHVPPNLQIDLSSNYRVYSFSCLYCKLNITNRLWWYWVDLQIKGSCLWSPFQNEERVSKTTRVA